jgi:hypothetical protein
MKGILLPTAARAVGVDAFEFLHLLKVLPRLGLVDRPKISAAYPTLFWIDGRRLAPIGRNGESRLAWHRARFRVGHEAISI